VVWLVKAARDAEHVAARPGREQAGWGRAAGGAARDMVVVGAIDDQAAAFQRHFDFHAPGPRGAVAAPGRRRARCRRGDRGLVSPKAATIRVRQPTFRFGAATVWWQWTTWPRGVMNHISSAGTPDLLIAVGDELDGRLGPLAAYLDALGARVAALERRSSAIIRGGTGFSAAPASRAKGKRCRRGGMAGAGLNLARQLGHGCSTPTTPRWTRPTTQRCSPEQTPSCARRHASRASGGGTVSSP
jgi:hypothetical protein